MNRHPGVLAWLVLAAVAGAAATAVWRPRDAETAPAAVAVKTELGAGFADIVTLERSGATGARTFHRVRADGTTDPVPFVVPAGTALYVTDAEWIAGWSNPSRGPYDRALRLRLVNTTDPAAKGTVAVLGQLPLDNPDAGTEVQSAGSWRPHTGFVAGNGCRIEIDAPQDLDAATGDPTDLALHGEVVLRGYLIRAK